MGKVTLLILGLFPLACLVISDDLPTNYEYYLEEGITSGLNADQNYFLLNGKNITIFSGAFHYFRVHNTQWRSRLRLMRAAGLNAVETYVPWNLHEYQSGSYDFGQGGSDFEEFLDIAEFIRLAQEEDLFVLVRAGPYICSEWEFGGLPSWLLRESDFKVRQNNPVFLNYVARYFEELFAILEPLQFTYGGPIIALQVENEYGNTQNDDKEYLRALVEIYRDNGIIELLYTSDPPSAGTRGALPDELLMTANFNSDPAGNLNKLDSLQTYKPTMTMEYWSGWYDHWDGDQHSTVSTDHYKTLLEEIITHPSSVNIYMFVGSTNFGFTSGANSGSSFYDNSGLLPDTTSYDYDSPITEAGEITAKYNATKELIAKYNPVKTCLPEIVNTTKRIVYDDIKVEEQILLSEVLDSYQDKISSENVVSMEKLSINNNSGQSYGYIGYRKTGLNIRIGTVARIIGFIRDHMLVLVNGKLVNSVITKKSDLDGFGYWRLENSTITLTNEDLQNATLDLLVENHSRNNYGNLNQFYQYKGLIDEVLIDDEVIKDWEITPLEFKRSWNQQISGWHPVQDREATPALYRGFFNVEDVSADTFVNMQDWRKGIVIINGFVLGRFFAVGPQQALYLPGGLLKEGQNEIIIFEHFTAPEYIKFTSDHIWGLGTYIEE